MSKLKKTLAVVLCVILMFGTAPLNCLAELKLPELRLSELNLHLPKNSLFNIFEMFVTKAKATDTPTSGSCGENLTWNLDESTFTLSISGTGDMTDYDWDNSVYSPWNKKRDKIINVNIDYGVTSIGDYA
ncbi:MAG: hypothetical protein IKH13_07820, partial [Clostridia bacterium]|nr:hypothetical protein [Clostridia bacterium]